MSATEYKICLLQLAQQGVDWDMERMDRGCELTVGAMHLAAAAAENARRVERREMMEVDDCGDKYEEGDDRDEDAEGEPDDEYSLSAYKALAVASGNTTATIAVPIEVPGTFTPDSDLFSEPDLLLR